ncbi:MAG: 2-oxo acid dehydrogenase subunit E2 [Anaerolineae bacterium]|nr:2-oxo acid dehydrogenase subunit E2 [Anaerolineae bacterium]
MPDLATTDSEVTLLHWLVETGQSVRLGQPLVEIETDKATMEVESVAAGTLQAIHAEPGDRVAVGQMIAVIVNDAPEPAQASSGASVAQAESAAPSAVPVPAAPAKTGGSFFARNREARVQPAADNGSIPLSGIQRDIARRLQESKQNIPHFYLMTSANAGAMVSLRAASPQKIVWDAFFVKAVANALKDFERVRYRFDGDKLTRNPDAIGVAVDIDEVLYVVPVENPSTLTLAQISERITTRAEGIRSGDPAARKLGGTCITITNLGMENIELFQAIINPPEVAILAIGKIAPTVCAVDGQIVIQDRVGLSLSADHRVVNGKYGARFLSRVVQEIEGGSELAE